VDLRSHIAFSTELGSAVARAITAHNRCSKTKVSNLKVELFVVKQILWLKISVCDTVVVNIVQTINELSEIEAADSLVECTASCYVIEELSTGC
jgi:hypothetical protein